jgi:hypothetical protein
MLVYVNPTEDKMLSETLTFVLTNMKIINRFGPEVNVLVKPKS